MTRLKYINCYQTHSIIGCNWAQPDYKHVKVSLENHNYGLSTKLVLLCKLQFNYEAVINCVYRAFNHSELLSGLFWCHGISIHILTSRTNIAGKRFFFPASEQFLQSLGSYDDYLVLQKRIQEMPTRYELDFPRRLVVVLVYELEKREF